MKNSAWYNRLWSKKLSELPVKDEADTAWAEMSRLLDQHLPAAHGANSNPKFWGSKVVSMLGYILPAAAMIGGVTYVTVHTSQTFKAKPRKDTASYKSQNNFKKAIPAKSDSLLVNDNLPNSESLAGKDSARGQIAATSTATTATGGTATNFSKLEEAVNPLLFNRETTGNRQSRDLNSLRSQKNNNRIPADNYSTGSAGKLPEIKARDTAITPGRKAGLVDPATNQLALFENNTRAAGNDVPPAVAQQPANLATGGGSSKITANNVVNNKKQRIQRIPTVKSPKVKQRKAEVPKADKTQIGLPATNYGIEAGLSLTGGKNFYIGLTHSRSINNKWLINAGLRLDLSRPVSGVHTHRSFNPADSSAFSVLDSRKAQTLSIPLDLGYRLSNHISIHAGPQFSYGLKQTDRISKLGTITNFRDTLGKSNFIDSAFRRSSINKFTIGAAVGVSVKVKAIYIDARYYQSITPYKVNTGLGNYQDRYKSVQLGIRYQLKK